VKNKNVLLVILFTIFVDILGFGLLIPVFPQLLANPQSPFYLLSSSLNLSQGYILLGWLSSMFSIMIFLVAPIFGQLSDKYGRKNILLIALLGTAGSYALFAYAISIRSIPLMFVSRSLDGIMGSSIVAAQAAIADITKPKDRARNFGLMGATFGLGIILGPFVGGILSDPSVIAWFNATTPFCFASILGFINVIFIMSVFKETNLKQNKKLPIDFRRAFTNIAKVSKLGNTRSILLMNFLQQGGFAFFTTFFAVFLVHRFSLAQSDIGSYFSYLGFWVIVSQAVVLPFLSRRFREDQILRYSLFFMSIFIFLNIFPSQIWMILLITPFFAISNGLSQANSTALISRSAEDDTQGEILGINSSITSLASAIPPILSGYIAAKFLPEATVVVSAIVIFFAWISFVVIYRYKQKCEWGSYDCPENKYSSSNG